MKRKLKKVVKEKVLKVPTAKQSRILSDIELSVDELTNALERADDIACEMRSQLGQLRKEGFKLPDGKQMAARLRIDIDTDPSGLSDVQNILEAVEEAEEQSARLAREKTYGKAKVH